MESDGSSRDIYRTRSQLDAYEDFSSLRASDLKLRIEEMLRIKVSHITHQRHIRLSPTKYTFTEHSFGGIERIGIETTETSIGHRNL